MMNFSHQSAPSFLALALSSLVVLSGCEKPLEAPRTTNYSQVETITSIHAVRFDEGQSRISKAERQRLYRHLAMINPLPEDRIQVEWPLGIAPGDGSLEASRTASVQQDLQRQGFVVGAYSPKESASGRVRVLVERLSVHAPGDCLKPKLQKEFGDAFVDGKSQTHGCATASNFAKMLANPYDAKSGRVTGGARMERLTGAQQRYDAGAPLTTSGSGDSSSGGSQ
ncbi:CpaD family pilus assembly lipoprotein [Rhodovibrionaceae bacterium A322]